MKIICDLMVIIVFKRAAFLMYHKSFEYVGNFLFGDALALFCIHLLCSIDMLPCDISLILMIQRARDGIYRASDIGQSVVAAC